MIADIRDLIIIFFKVITALGMRSKPGVGVVLSSAALPVAIVAGTTTTGIAVMRVVFIRRRDAVGHPSF